MDKTKDKTRKDKIKKSIKGKTVKGNDAGRLGYRSSRVYVLVLGFV